MEPASGKEGALPRTGPPTPTPTPAPAPAGFWGGGGTPGYRKLLSPCQFLLPEFSSMFFSLGGNNNQEETAHRSIITEAG